MRPLLSRLDRPAAGFRPTMARIGATVAITVAVLGGLGTGAASATPGSLCPAGTPVTGGIPLGGPSSVAVSTQTAISATTLLGPVGTVIHSMFIHGTGTTAVGAYTETIVDHYASQDLCIPLSNSYSFGPTGLLQKFPYYLSLDQPGGKPSGLGHHYVHGLLRGLNPSDHLPSYVTPTWTVLVTSTGTVVMA